MITRKPLAVAVAAFCAVLLASGTTHASQSIQEQAKENFLQADVNQDGLLDIDEFTRFINLNAEHGLGRAAMVRRFGMQRRAFGKLDVNRDGVVSPQEIAAAAKQR